MRSPVGTVETEIHAGGALMDFDDREQWLLPASSLGLLTVGILIWVLARKYKRETRKEQTLCQ
jgi:predicted permease